jgi:type IV pilus assembly protein PilP
MKNSLALIRTLICLMGTALLLLSCDDSNLIAAQPQVVRKKLIGQVEGAPPAPQNAIPSAVTLQIPAEGPKPMVAHVKAQNIPTPPPPKPMEPVPSTHADGVAAAAQTGEPPKPEGAATQTAPPPGPQAQKPEAAVAVTESQAEAFLNTRVPPHYNPQGKPDPFEPYVKLTGVQVLKTLQPKKRAPQTPLEQMELSQLKLVAIGAGSGYKWAIVEESTGKGYTLKEGTYIGMNSGKVADITPDKIIIEEEYITEEGKTVIEKKEMTLPKPPGEM